MMATALSKIQLDYRNSVSRLHESIQLIERTMDASRNELAQVLDAEIRTRQKQEAKNAAVHGAHSEQIALHRNSLDQQLQDLTAMTTRITEETRSLSKREHQQVKDQHSRLMADTETRFSMQMVQLTRLEQASSTVQSEIQSQIEMERKHTDSSVATLQERTLAQLKLIESRLESLPTQVEQTNQRVHSLRSEMGARFVTEGTERGRDLDQVHLKLARKVETDLLDRSNEGLRDRLERTEGRCTELVGQIGVLDRELAGTKAMLGTKLRAEEAQRSENDEELRQQIARTNDRSMQAVRELSVAMNQMESYSPSPDPHDTHDPHGPLVHHGHHDPHDPRNQHDGEDDTPNSSPERDLAERDLADTPDSRNDSQASLFTSQPLQAIAETDADDTDGESETDDDDDDHPDHSDHSDHSDTEDEDSKSMASVGNNSMLTNAMLQSAQGAEAMDAETTDNETEDETENNNGKEAAANPMLVAGLVKLGNKDRLGQGGTDGDDTEDEDAGNNPALPTMAHMRSGDPADMPLDLHGGGGDDSSMLGSSDEDDAEDTEDETDNEGQNSDAISMAGSSDEEDGEHDDTAGPQFLSKSKKGF